MSDLAIWRESRINSWQHARLPFPIPNTSTAELFTRGSFELRAELIGSASRSVSDFTIYAQGAAGAGEGDALDMKAPATPAFSRLCRYSIGIGNPETDCPIGIPTGVLSQASVEKCCPSSVSAARQLPSVRIVCES